MPKLDPLADASIVLIEASSNYHLVFRTSFTLEREGGVQVSVDPEEEKEPPSPYQQKCFRCATNKKNSSASSFSPQKAVYGEDISRLGCATTIVQASGVLFLSSLKKMSPPEIDAATGVTIDSS